jgi:hypothetical protein
VLIASAAVCALAALIGVVLACRVSLRRDDALGTVTAVKLLSRSEFKARDVVAVRIVPFPWVRQRGPSATTSPMIEVKTVHGASMRMLATAVDTKRGRIAALDFLRAAGVRPLPTSDEYVNGVYVAQQWTPAGTRAHPRRR